MRCNHEMAVITEHANTYTRHYKSKGDWFHDCTFREYTSVVFIECECGLKKTYNRYAKSCPKWVKRMLEEAIGVSFD